MFQLTVMIGTQQMGKRAIMVMRSKKKPNKRLVGKHCSEVWTGNDDWMAFNLI